MTPWVPIGVALAFQFASVCAMLFAFLPLRVVERIAARQQDTIAQISATADRSAREVEANNNTIALLRAKLKQEEDLLHLAGKRMSVMATTPH